MSTAYVIIGSCGEYDDYSEWPIVVVLSKEKAAALVEEFEKRGEELKAKLDACERPEYPRVMKDGKIPDDVWDKYIESVYKNDADREAIYMEHPASKYSDVNLDAYYQYHEIELIEE